MKRPLILGLFILLISIQFTQASTDTTTYQVDVNSSSLKWSLDVHYGSILLKNGTIMERRFITSEYIKKLSEFLKIIEKNGFKFEEIH